MGCLSSRETKLQIFKESTPIHNFLNILSHNQLTDTVIIQSTLFNYSYCREDQIWVLRKRKALFTLNSMGILEKETHNSDTMLASMDIGIKNQQLILRPPQNTIPKQQLIELQQSVNSKFKQQQKSTYFEGLGDRLATSLQPGDRFPGIIVSESLFSSDFTNFNLGSNEKFTFIMSWRFNSQASKKSFHRFLQLYKYQWSKIIPTDSKQLYGLCRGSFQEDKQSFEQQARKCKWDAFTNFYQDESMKDPCDGEYYSARQVFNLIDDQDDQEIFIVLNPKGKVIIAEIPYFLVEKKPRNSNTSDNKSQSSYHSDEADASKQSHSIQFERSVEKVIKKSMNQLQLDLELSRPIESQLSKKQLEFHNILSNLSIINHEQYLDYKNFFMSPELQSFLDSMKMGEQFQIELQKFVIHKINDQQEGLKEPDAIYLIPQLYPSCAPSKEQLIPQIQQFLHDNIPLGWKSPSLSSYILPRQNTILKELLMEDIHDQLSSIGINNLQLYLQKDRRFEWNKQAPIKLDNCQQFDATAREWISSSIIEKGIQFSSNLMKIENIPIGFEGQRNYEGMIRFAYEASKAKNDPANASINFQSLDPIAFQLITDFYQLGISTEVVMGTRYVPIPQCIQINLEDLNVDLGVMDIPFGEGQKFMIYLIDWERGAVLLKDFFYSLKSFLGDNKLRLIVLSANSAPSINNIQELSLEMVGSSLDVEFWAPLEDHCNNCVEYLFQGLLCKFYGLEVDGNNMLLFNSAGDLEFRGSEHSELFDCLVKENHYEKLNEDNFVRLYPHINVEDSQWQAVKKYFSKNKLQLDDLFQQLNKISSEGSYIRIESTKYKVWQKEQHKFIDYSTVLKLEYELNEQGTVLMFELIEAFKDLV